MIYKRSSGILAHMTSLASPYGIGDIGTAAYQFIDFLSQADQSCWQFLPTGPTNTLFDHSPYMSTSAFAGSPLLLSPDLLFQAGLLSRTSLDAHPDFSPYTTEFTSVWTYKKRLLQEAYTLFRKRTVDGYDAFVQSSPWLESYAQFMTAKELYDQSGWFDWPRDIARRAASALDTFSAQNEERISYYRFEQFEFFRQWHLLHQYAKDKKVELFGDLPIYVGYDSVDVWAEQDIFTLDRSTLRPTLISGVPPDYFSKTGQRWGNPLYEWQNKDPLIQDRLLAWWSKRLEHLFTQVDIARIDHFRGFESYWAIPEENETAIDGTWLKGPGKPFFDAIFEIHGPLNIVAEDLGIITPEVEILRDELQFPGMKVLQFAFDGNTDNSFLPHNFTTPDCIVYTGTHDNDTTLGWFLSDKVNDHQRREVRQYANSSAHGHDGIHEDLIYLAQASISKLCILPLQDILGFGNDCKMNSPGVATGNWRWRCAEKFLSEEVAENLKRSTRRFNRGRTEDDSLNKEDFPLSNNK